ncbi:MAG: hypothetical protein ACC645_11085 [Pirellulales bacterium]
MTVQCANCGEELLGAVNRCWRCGRIFVPQKGSDEAPPIRRAPVTPAAGPPATAEVIGQGNTRAAKRIHRGSPFATSSIRSNDDSPPPSDADRPFLVRTPRGAAPAVGAALSLVLGLVSLLIGFGFPAGGVVTAVVGVSMGCWGLTSDRRGLATFGLVLCCLALSVSGFYAVVDAYSYFYGVDPFETAIPGDAM